MPSVIERKLNRTFRATLAPGEIGSGFLAVQVYSAPGNPIYIDGVTFGVVVATAADAALILSQSVRCVRDAQFQIGVPFGTTLAQTTFEEYYADAGGPGAGGQNDDFNEPIILEAGYQYTFIHEGPFTSGAPAGNITLFMTVRGRTVPDKPVEPSPVELRSGIPEGAPDGCTQITEG